MEQCAYGFVIRYSFISDIISRINIPTSMLFRFIFFTHFHAVRVYIFCVVSVGWKEGVYSMHTHRQMMKPEN